MNSVDSVGAVGQSPAEMDRLRQFRGELYQCLGRRADELFELTEALLCAAPNCAWPVTSPLTCAGPGRSPYLPSG